MDKDEKFQLTVNLKNRQKALNRKYEKEGLTDELLDKQVELNKLRHEHDITDETEKVFEDFVQ